MWLRHAQSNPDLRRDCLWQEQSLSKIWFVTGVISWVLHCRVASSQSWEMHRLPPLHNTLHPSSEPWALGSWFALWVSLHSWIPSGCFFCALGPEFSLNLHCTGPTPCPRQAAGATTAVGSLWGDHWGCGPGEFFIFFFYFYFVKQTRAGSTEEMLEHMGLPSWQEWLDITLSHCSAPLSLAPAPARAAFAVGHRSIFIFRTNKVT